MSTLGVNRELLWRKLFAFDDDVSTSAQQNSEYQRKIIENAVVHGRHEPLREMLLQRLGYWLRSDIVPPFWGFFDPISAKIKRNRNSKQDRRRVALLCAQQLTLALQFAKEAFAHCVEIASLFDDHVQLRRGQWTMLQELQIRFRTLVFEDLRSVEKFEELLIIFFSMSFYKFRGKEQSEVKTTCGEVYDELFLADVEQWTCSDLMPWLKETLQTNDEVIFSKWKKIVSQHTLEEFGSLRIKQLFEIIKEFPDSIPALEDLRQCLERTQQHGELVQEFRRALQSRLLQPGANTSAILDIYVSAIKAFQLLDPKGVLLEGLSGPIKELRRDNMRMIQHDDDSDDDEDISPDSWEPDPIDADPTKSSRSRSSDDILRILVNIYGSRELFVNEYRIMLADKLLQNLEFDTDRDVQTLELLKLRFGEDSLQQCEIMVRDVDDSKRLNRNALSAMENFAIMKEASTDNSLAHSTTPSSYVDATIVSQQFWPPLQGEDFKLHSKVSKDIDAFKEAYSVLRNPRSLDWNASLGSVQLSIELENEVREFTLSPIQATIILHFEDKNRWKIEELAAQLEISDDLLLKHISLVGSKSYEDTRCDNDLVIEELETAVSSDAQAHEDLKVLEAYIVGMLSNFGSLTIQRIHNMLATFARSGTQPYTKTISGLSVVLGKLVSNGKLEFFNGQYQLAK
ncbi:putative cullin, anaphase-promoting complex subunit 2, cullin domain superfamily [Plasmopara halstedii]